MFKKITVSLGFSFILALSLFVPVASAQSTEDQNPAVYVQDIKLSKSEYTAGETIQGTFTLANGKDAQAPNIIYSISLVGGYSAGGLAANLYDSKTVNTPITLDPKQTREITFSFEHVIL